MRICVTCKEEKLDEEMSSTKGQTMYCLPCKRAYDKEYYQKNKEKVLAKAKEAYAKKLNKPSKYCSRCKELKYLSEYHKCAKTIDGYENRCKDCVHEIYLNKKNSNHINKNISRIDKIECYKCKVKFNDEIKYFSKNMCKKCYYKMLYVVKPRTKYDDGRWSRKKEIENQLEINKLRVENLKRLNSFINDVKRKSGYINMVDSFIMADLFEIYGDGRKYDLDALPVERQLISMWEYLKTK
jgi:hypothetical protein